MSNQPYEGRREGYDPYQQPQGHPSQEPQQHADWPQHTQQWEGRTWETQAQAPVQEADASYPPPQGYQTYGESQGYGGVAGATLPPEAPAQPWNPDHAPAAAARRTRPAPAGRSVTAGPCPRA